MCPHDIGRHREGDQHASSSGHGGRTRLTLDRWVLMRCGCPGLGLALRPQSLLARKTGPGDNSWGPVMERGRLWWLSLVLHQSSRDRWLRSGLCRWYQAILQEMTKPQPQGIPCPGHHVPQSRRDWWSFLAHQPLNLSWHTSHARPGALPKYHPCLMPLPCCPMRPSAPGPPFLHVQSP